MLVSNVLEVTMPLSRAEVLLLLLVPGTRQLAILVVYSAGMPPLHIVNIMERLGVSDKVTREDLATVINRAESPEEEDHYPQLLVALAKARLTPEAVSTSEDVASLSAEIIETYIQKEELLAFAEGGAMAAAKLQMIDDYSFNPELFWLNLLKSIIDTHEAQLREEEDEEVAQDRKVLKEFILGSSIVTVGDHREKIRLTPEDIKELGVSMAKKGQVPEGDA